jgi:TolB-like protein
VAALVVVAAGSAGTWRAWLERRSSTANARTLAVLPLQDLSGDSTHGDVAEAMAMALTTTLGSAESVRVTAPLSADRFKGRRIPERAIGESLGVAELVEGDLQRVHDSLRVDLRLIDAASEQQRWGGQFEGAFSNRIGLEEAMSRAILSALQVPGSLRPPPTSNPAAYDFYMRGKIRLQHEDRENDSIAIALLERAVALDPGFAVAYAELAHAYGLRSLQFDPEDRDARERAQVASAKALALGPDLAESHFAQAFLLWTRERRYPHQSVISEDHQALLLNPNLAVAHQHLGQVYLHIGLLDSAIAEFRTTLALDPVEGLALQRIGIALVYQGHYEEGLRTFREVPSDLNPALWHYQVAWALLYLGRDSEALDTINLYLHDHPKDPGGLLTAARAILEAKRGDTGATEADIKTAIAKGSGFQHFHHAAYSIAMAYALLHRPEPAVRFLREAADEGLPCYPCFRNDPYLAAIRADTGYVSLMRELESQWSEWRGALRGAP